MISVHSRIFVNIINMLLLQCQMVVQDRLEREKGIAKNAVEAYVYDMRGKLYGELERFITDEVCTALTCCDQFVHVTCPCSQIIFLHSLEPPCTCY